MSTWDWVEVAIIALNVFSCAINLFAWRKSRRLYRDLTNKIGA